MTARTSFTPESSAESCTNCRFVAREMTCASVVLPVPGGPYRTSDIGSSDSTSRRSGARGPSRCCWPTTSSSPCGRIRTARGAPGSTGVGPVSSGSSNSELTIAKLPAGHDNLVQQRRIGNLTVSAIGLGAMPLSTKENRPTPADAEAVVHAALDAGVTLIDTADAYARDESEFGHNEILVASALRSYGRTDVLVATKGGHTRRGRDWELDGSPAYLRRACEASLRRLGVEAIGLYQFHRPDPATPWEESMGALRSLFDDGLVRMVGISNASVEQIDAARAIVGH